MKMDYQAEYKKELLKNVSVVRSKMNDGDFQYKIGNWADKFGYEKEEVESMILENDMFAATFAKDPSKQNIYERLAVKYLKEISIIENFKNLPNNTKLFVVDGQITNVRDKEVKSIDFTFNVGDKKFYCSHKYIKALNGGAQGNQYNDVRNFLRNCNKRNEGNEYFIAICDGPYFDSKISTMNEDFGTSHVNAMTIESVEDFLKELMN